MARQVTPGDQVIDMMLQAHTCDLEDVMRRCPNPPGTKSFSRLTI